MKTVAAEQYLLRVAEHIESVVLLRVPYLDGWPHSDDKDKIVAV
jgi:hypothetical protein